MTKKFARITTHSMFGTMSYEIFGTHIPRNREIEDDFEQYLELELVSAHDKVICFGTYSLNASIVEIIAWSDSDTPAIQEALNARMATETTMPFMTWFWRNEYQKATATAIATATTTAENYEKPFYVDDEISVQVMWKYLFAGKGLKTHYEGEYFELSRFVDYDDCYIAVMLKTVRKEYFVKSFEALHKLFDELEILNIAWGFTE